MAKAKTVEELNALRTQKAQQQAALGEEIGQIQEQITAIKNEAKLERMLATLPEQFRAAARSAIVEGMSAEATSDAKESE